MSKAELLPSGRAMWNFCLEQRNLEIVPLVRSPPSRRLLGSLGHRVQQGRLASHIHSFAFLLHSRSFLTPQRHLHQIRVQADFGIILVGSRAQEGKLTSHCRHCTILRCQRSVSTWYGRLRLRILSVNLGKAELLHRHWLWHSLSKIQGFQAVRVTRVWLAGSQVLSFARIEDVSCPY